MVDWQRISYNEPPITATLSEVDFKEIIDKPESSALAEVGQVLNHTQAVKRGAKLVTVMSSKDVVQKDKMV